jgi:hypothetical protein
MEFFGVLFCVNNNENVRPAKEKSPAKNRRQPKMSEISHLGCSLE